MANAAFTFPFFNLDAPIFGNRTDFTARRDRLGSLEPPIRLDFCFEAQAAIPLQVSKNLRRESCSQSCYFAGCLLCLIGT